MNRTLIVFVVALIIFTLVFFLTENINSDVVIEDELEPEILVSVYQVENDVNKRDIVEKDLLTITKISLKDFELKQYIEVNDSDLNNNIIFRTGVKRGSLLTRDMFSIPGENDYIDLVLQENEIPYLYDDISNFSAKSLNLNTGDKISFISTTSSKSNILSSGYDDISHLVSKVIIKNSRVIQVLKEKKENSDEYNTSVVVALSPKQILSLEMARKIGDISIIPSTFSSVDMSVRSSHLLENQFGVRELRGGSKNESNY